MPFNVGDTFQTHTISINDDMDCEDEPNEIFSQLLPVATVLLGLLCRINRLLHCGQGAGICIGCEYQVLIG